MKKILIALGGLSLLAAPVFAADTPLTLDSTVKELLDNPKTLAVLKAEVPEIVANPQLQMALEMPFRGIAQYAPEALNDEHLAKIAAGLASAQAN